MVFAGLWSPFEESPLYESVAYGLPALLEGRWWTPITGTFFVNHPLVYLFTIASFIGMAYLEFRRGSRVALAYFGIGQLFAIFASALLLWLFAFLPWPWAQQEALALDVGPSGGSMACIAAAAGLLAAPWRVRAWALLLGFTFVTLFFWGSLADLEHALAVGLVLFVDRSLRFQRTTVREQRLIAFVSVLAVLAIDILTFLVPTNGPFGHTDAVDGSVIDVAIDVVVILFIANGLRRGRRWAWVLGIILGAFNVLSGVLFVTLLFIPGATIEAGVGDRQRGDRAVGDLARAAGLPDLRARRVPRPPQGDDRSGRRADGRGRQGRAARARRWDPVVDDDLGGQQLRAHLGRHRRPTRSGRASRSCWPIPSVRLRLAGSR